MSQSPRLGLLGSGSWATAIAKMLVHNTETLHWWVRREETAEYLQMYGRNPHYIQSISLPTSQLRVSTNMQEVIDASDILIFAIPSVHLHRTIQEHKPQGLADKVIFSAIKGMVVEYNSIPARYFHKEFRTPYNRIGLIAGPCHAEEVAREKLSYLTVACPDLALARTMADLLTTRYIRVNTSEDVFGTELAAVLKNIYAIAAGIAHGLGYGDNFLSVLIANASQEMKRFLAAVHQVDRDVKGSPYLGGRGMDGEPALAQARTIPGQLHEGPLHMSQQRLRLDGFQHLQRLHQPGLDRGRDGAGGGQDHLRAGLQLHRHFRQAQHRCVP